MALSLYTVDLGTPSLADVGYVFKDRLMADIGARTETGVSELSPGFYGVTLETTPTNAALIFWDSTSEPDAYAYGNTDHPAGAEGGPGTGSGGPGDGDAGTLQVAGRPSLEVVAMPEDPGSPNADARHMSWPDGSFAVELWRQDPSRPEPDIKFALSRAGKSLKMVEGTQDNVLRVVRGGQAVYYLVAIGPVLRLPVGTYEVNATVNGRAVPDAWVTVKDSPFASGDNSGFDTTSEFTITGVADLQTYGLESILEGGPDPVPSRFRTAKRPSLEVPSLYTAQPSPKAGCQVVAHPDGSFTTLLLERGEPEPDIHVALTKVGKRVSLLENGQEHIFKVAGENGKVRYHFVVDGKEDRLPVATYALHTVVDGAKRPTVYVSVEDSPWATGSNSGYAATDNDYGGAWVIRGHRVIPAGTTLLEIRYRTLFRKIPTNVAVALYDASGDPVENIAAGVGGRKEEYFQATFDPAIPAEGTYTLQWAAWL